jgi:hypothetical protein
MQVIWAARGLAQSFQPAQFRPRPPW